MFVPGKTSQPGLTFAGSALRRGYLKGAPLSFGLIHKYKTELDRLVCAQNYFKPFSFLTSAQIAQNKLVFVLHKPFQPGLIFAGKVRSVKVICGLMYIEYGCEGCQRETP